MIRLGHAAIIVVLLGALPGCGREAPHSVPMFVPIQANGSVGPEGMVSLSPRCLAPKPLETADAIPDAKKQAMFRRLASERGGAPMPYPVTIDDPVSVPVACRWAGS